MPSIFGATVEPCRIGLGSAEFGGAISPVESFKILDAYHARGGNFLDTAHIYCAWRPGGWGASERTIGEWIRAHGLRDRVVLATKGAHPPMDDMAHGRGSRADIESDLRDSLERLGVDSVDLYWLHRDDPGRTAGEIVETLAALRADGRIRSYGGSNWTRDRLAAANDYARAHGLPPMVASQPGWALADFRPEAVGVAGMLYMDEPTRQWHIGSGLPVVAYTAQAGGYFGEDNVRWARDGFDGAAPRGDRTYDTPANRGRLRRAIELADRVGCTPNQIALAYVLNQPFPTYALVGTSNPAHLDEAMDALRIELEGADCDYLREGHA